MLALTFHRFAYQCHPGGRRPGDRLARVSHRVFQGLTVRDVRGPGRTKLIASVLGALLTCVGLVTMALQGLASEGPLGVNLLATGLVVGGVALSTFGAAKKSELIRD